MARTAARSISKPTPDHSWQLRLRVLRDRSEQEGLRRGVVQSPVCAIGVRRLQERDDLAADDGCADGYHRRDRVAAPAIMIVSAACARWPAEKCQPVTLGSGLETPQAVTIDANYVHWVDGGRSRTAASCGILVSSAGGRDGRRDGRRRRRRASSPTGSTFTGRTVAVARFRDPSHPVGGHHDGRDREHVVIRRSIQVPGPLRDGRGRISTLGESIGRKVLQARQDWRRGDPSSAR